MKAGVFLAALAALGFAVWAFWPERDPWKNMLITSALLQPVGETGAALIVAMRNDGRPDHLLSARVDGVPARAVGIPAGDGLAIPTGMSSLATEGAHFGTELGIEAEDGTLVPVSLRFARAGELNFRARVTLSDDTDMPEEMHHPGARRFVDVLPGEPSPGVTLETVPDGDGWRVLISTRNFSFNAAAVDGAHVPGEGHGHVYVGGLKLGRVFGDVYRIGALPRGSHSVTVELNTNDHGVYRVEGVPVSASSLIVVD